MDLWFVFRTSPTCYIYCYHGITAFRLLVRRYMGMLRASRRSNKRVHWRNEVGMISATACPARFQDTGIVTLAIFLQTLRFPGSAAFHRRVEDFRLRVAVYTMLHSYTNASPLCVCLWTRLHGGAGPHSLLIQLHPPALPRYTGMYSLPMYNGYDTYGALRRSYRAPFSCTNMATTAYGHDSA